MEWVVDLHRRYTRDEYFEIEQRSDRRYEFRNGLVVDLSGTSYSHSVISSNVCGAGRAALKGTQFRASAGSLRLRLGSSAEYGHPDLTVLHAEPQINPDDKFGQTVTNPTFVVEVLSPSTENYDRSKKFEKYRRNESFREYMLVSQDEPRVETFYKTNDGTWSIGPAADTLTATVTLRSLNVTLPMSEIYAGVNFASGIDEGPNH